VTGNWHFPGTTVLAGLKAVAGDTLGYSREGKFDGEADVGVLVVGERGYAEGVGDRPIEALRLADADLAALDAMRPKVKKLLLLLVAGRPLVIDSSLPKLDAVVMAWQPGSEGAGIADVLFGDKPFSGRLPIGWPANAAGYTRADAPPAERCASLQWAVGFGLDVSGKPLGPTSCP
jgi:beta-glucosidase